MKTINKFNRGEISPLALARNDVDKVADTCELMDNFIPMRLGPMRFRPGFEYIADGFSPTTDTTRALLPLTRSIDNSVMFEFAGTTMRPLVDGLPVVQPVDSYVLVDETFPTIAVNTSWNTVSPAAWSTYGTGSLSVSAGGTAHQSSGAVTAGVLQTYIVEVERGPVRVLVGEGAVVGAKDLLDHILYPGRHYVRFAPTTTQFTITFAGTGITFGTANPAGFVMLCESLAAGSALAFTVPAVEYRGVSYDVSADVLFMAMGADEKPRVVKRVGSDVATNSGYSFEEYYPLRGPYKGINLLDVEIATSVSGASTLVQSTNPYFTPDLEGTLMKVPLVESRGSTTFSATGLSNGVVSVMGYGDNREMLITITGGGGTWELALKRKIGLYGTYETVETFDTAGATIYLDRFDGKLTLYQVECTVYGGTPVTVEVLYVSTESHGHGVVQYLNASSVSLSGGDMLPSQGMQPVTAGPYYNLRKTWYHGAWSAGAYPQGVTFYEGRLVWVSKNRVDMTVTDDYINFDTTLPGASAAISRTIGFGPVDDISWCESNNRLWIGLPTTEVLVRSNNFDEPLTSINTNLKPGKGLGSKPVRAVPVDDDIYFVSREGKRVHRVNYDIAGDTQYAGDEMTLHPTICEDGIKSMQVTKHPEYRLWVVTNTGELRVLLKDPAEGVRAWSRVTIDGIIEDICVIPSTGEDELWAIVRRGGSSRIERLSEFSAIKPLDSFKEYISPGTGTLTGLDHLNGKVVHVWADGQHRAIGTVVAGTFNTTLPVYTNVIVGLPYVAQYKSNKLAGYVTDSVVSERKTVTGTALVMRDYAPGALQVGRDFTHLVDLPGVVQAGPLITDYDKQAFGFPGASDTDSRICLQATGPCTIMALSFDIYIPPKKSSTTNG